MNRKAFSLVIAGVMLFSVLLVHPVAAQGTNSPTKTLKIVQLTSTNSLFMGVFNPGPSGMTDIYTVKIWYFVYDRPYITGPDSQFHNYKCQLVSVQENVKVPSSAVIWNGTQKKWIAPYAGKTAPSAVTWKCGLGQWQDGQPITLADFMYDFAMNFEWAYQNGKNDPFYDEKWNSNMLQTLSLIWGLKVDKLTNDYIEYTIYQNYTAPYGDWSIAVGNYMEAPSFPWELYNTMTYMVALTNEGKNVEGTPFAWDSTPQNGYQVDLIDPSQMKYFKYEADQLMNSNPVPVWLSTLTPVLQEWGISAQQAGITTDQAKAGYQAVINWINKYNNALISNGPYYVSNYNPSSLTLTLKLSNTKRVGFPGTITLNGKTYQLPWKPYWKEIQVYGTTNKDTALLAVAKAYYGFYWYATPMSDLSKVMQQYGSQLSLVKSVSTWWALDLNLVGNSTTGLVNSSGTIKFNPLALRGVRYAINWLIDRNAIVSQVLLGSGAPMFGPEVSGQVNAHQRIMTVAKALGLSSLGDKAYALKLIDQAMENAAKALKAKGYTLEKKNGYWYFNGQPVTLTVIGRTEDQRRVEAKYVKQDLESAGFKVVLKEYGRRQASGLVYGSSPYTLQWNVYTEGWVAEAIQPISWIAWDFWFFDYYVDPNWATSYHNPVTVQDLVNNVSNGDLNNFIQTLKLQYYDTPSKLKPLLDWTGYDLAMLLAYNSWKGPNNVSVKLTNVNQFWDLYKLAYGTHVLNSPRVYVAELWNFFVTNKNIVKVALPDPVSGLQSFIATRSIMPPSASLPIATSTTSSTTSTTSTSTTSSTSTSTSSSTTSTHTTSTTSTSTSSTTLTHTTSSSSVTSSTSSSSSPTSSSSPSSTTSKKKHICGPAALVGLALLPLLLRRRKK